MNWVEWKALHDLYQNGEVPLNKTLNGSDIFIYLERSLCVLEKSAKKVNVLYGYNAVYEKNYKTKFDEYNSFLQENNLLKPQSRFDHKDLEILINIKQGVDNGELVELRDQIISADESLRGISLMFFKNEKYLLGKQSLVDALKQILQVKEFSNERDQQYIYRLECHEAKVIVLCENLDFLTKPNKPREFGIELWYAGGWNIQKLHYADTRGLPIYYSCDWDLDGLQIFKVVKSIIPSVQLLSPVATPKDIKTTEHKSLWDKKTVLSGLKQNLFSLQQIELINQLIEEDQWIVEESNNLIQMLQKAKAV